MMRKIRLAFSIVLFLLAVVFALQNVATVEVRFLFSSLTLPRSLMIVLVLVIGVLIGWLLRGGVRRTRQ